MSTPEFIRRNFQPEKDVPGEGLPKPQCWNTPAADPIGDVMVSLEDMAAHGHGETAMKIGESLGILAGKDEQ